MIRTTDGYTVSSVDPVEFVSVWGNDDAVCDAARVSFNKKAAGYSVEQNNKLLIYLAREGHWSPFAHVMLKFRFHAPMFIARQFQKHVIGFNWNEVSRRYVSYDPTFFVPRSWRKRPDNMKQGSISEGEVALTDDVLTAYTDQMREHSKDYKSMIHQGICPEQVRMCMPQSMMTEWIWTGSLQAWSRFVLLRGDEHAQAECWQYADAVKYHMTAHFPLCSAAFFTGDSE